MLLDQNEGWMNGMGQLVCGVKQWQCTSKSTGQLVYWVAYNAAYTWKLYTLTNCIYIMCQCIIRNVNWCELKVISCKIRNLALIFITSCSSDSVDCVDHCFMFQSVTAISFSNILALADVHFKLTHTVNHCKREVLAAVFLAPSFFYPSTYISTRPNDGWAGLCIKLCRLLTWWLTFIDKMWHFYQDISSGVIYETTTVL